MISNIVKHFLRQYTHLIDKKEYETFLNQMWEESLTIENSIELFEILDSITPTPIPRNIRENFALKTLNYMVNVVSDLTLAEWENNYYYRSAIDKDGDLLIYNLLQGFRMHTFGFTEEELYKIAIKYKDIIWPDGKIYWA